jgi:hypothetical protein
MMRALLLGTVALSLVACAPTTTNSPEASQTQLTSASVAQKSGAADQARANELISEIATAIESKQAEHKAAADKAAADKAAADKAAEEQAAAEATPKKKRGKKGGVIVPVKLEAGAKAGKKKR